MIKRTLALYTHLMWVERQSCSNSAALTTSRLARQQSLGTAGGAGAATPSRAGYSRSNLAALSTSQVSRFVRRPSEAGCGHNEMIGGSGAARRAGSRSIERAATVAINLVELAALRTPDTFDALGFRAEAELLENDRRGLVPNRRLQPQGIAGIIDALDRVTAPVIKANQEAGGRAA